jgi:hypothetical protein
LSRHIQFHIKKELVMDSVEPKSWTEIGSK